MSYILYFSFSGSNEIKSFTKCWNVYWRLADKKAAIGYTYDDSTPADQDDDEESSDEEIDLGKFIGYVLNWSKSS